VKRFPHLAIALLLLGAGLVTFAPAGIIQAIIPAAVPTPNRQGSTGTKFFICTGAFVSGNLVSTDSNGNCTDFGSSTAGGGLVTYSSPAGLTLTAGTYFLPFGGGAAASTTEADVATLVNAAGPVTHLGAQLSSSIGGGNTAVFTVRDNGADTVLTCTMSASAACSDNSHAFNTVAGHTYTISLVTTGTIAVMPEVQVTALFGGVTSAPVTSVGGLTGAVPGEGNGSKVQLFTGSDPATNDCAKFDANHNIVGSGTGPCNSGGGGGSSGTPFIQAFSSAASTTVTPDLNVTSGNKLVLGVCSDTTPTSVTDGTNTWTKIATETGGGVGTITVWTAVAASSAGLTITLNGGTFGTFCQIIFGAELANAKFTTLDTSNGAIATHTSITTANANELVIGFSSGTSNGIVFVPRAPMVSGSYANGDGGLSFGYFVGPIATIYNVRNDVSNGNNMTLAIALM
jgi:hypothetical protein